VISPIAWNYSHQNSSFVLSTIDILGFDSLETNKFLKSGVEKAMAFWNLSKS
jgi:hypothetical protein